jgi:hypothetical protein
MPHDGGFCCVLSAWTTASCSMRATPGAPRSFASFLESSFAANPFSTMP